MSRKVHRIESREDPEPQPEQVSSPSVARSHSIPARNRKISTGPGLTTIHDDETGNVSEEEVKKPGAEMTTTSHGESETES